MNKLLIATNNPGKIAELKALLEDLPVILLNLRDFENIAEVEETGATFEENAVLKARGYAVQTRIWALADDSGLQIAALNNEPGVLSARYAGETTSFDEKMEKVLTEMDRTGDENRAARFVCAMALANENGEIMFTAEGACEGTIAAKPLGTNGFGYDPIFVPAGFEQTFGELSGDVKRKISHRARASAIIIRYLLDFIAI